MAKMKVIDCFRLRSRPSALLGTVALRIPSATHPEPLGCELADKEEAGMDVNPESGNRKPDFRLRIKERGLTGMERQAISGAGTSCPGSCPLQAMQWGLGQRPGIAGQGSQILVGRRGNALTT